MKPYEIKKLIGEINKLNDSAHDKIFEILLTHDINTEYSEKENDFIFVDLSKIDKDVLEEIKIFVNQYDEHVRYIKERDLLYEKAKISVDVMTDSDYTLDEIKRGSIKN